jgi:hypothetical protein
VSASKTECLSPDDVKNAIVQAIATGNTEYALRGPRCISCDKWRDEVDHMVILRKDHRSLYRATSICSECIEVCASVVAHRPCACQAAISS